MKYRVSGLPRQAQVGITAFLPHFNRLAASGAQEYKDGVYGYPGTKGIPAPTTNTTPQPDLGDLALYGVSASRYAPDMIWPNLYWARPERNYRPGLLIQMYDPTRPQDTTMIPVPAVSLRQLYLQRSAALSAGIQPGGSSGKNLAQPISQLVSWAQRRTGGGLANG